MSNLLVFKCWSCEQEFQIALENLHSKISVQCQNCDHPLPKSALEPLRNLGNAYMDVVDALKHTNTYDSSWGISVKSTEKFIPQRASRYPYLNENKDDSYWQVRRKPFEPNSLDNHGIKDSELPF